jgi:hypothetical protein
MVVLAAAAQRTQGPQESVRLDKEIQAGQVAYHLAAAVVAQARQGRQVRAQLAALAAQVPRHQSTELRQLAQAAAVVAHRAALAALAARAAARQAQETTPHRQQQPQILVAVAAAVVTHLAQEHPAATAVQVLSLFVTQSRKVYHGF